MRERIKRVFPLVLGIAMPVAILVTFVCCTPQWSPDGESFVFVTAKGAHWHNLKTKETKILGTAEKEGFYSASMWPDGKHVAVTVFSGDSPNMKTTVFNWLGDKTHESPEFKFPKGIETRKPSRIGTSGKDDKVLYFPSYVSADESHVIVFIPQIEIACAYDLKTKSFRVYEDLLPLNTSLKNSKLLTETYPITAAGDQFYAYTVKKEAGKETATIGLARFEWESEKPTELKLPEGLSLLTDETLGLAPDWHWEMGVLVGRFGKGVVSLRVDSDTVVFEEDERTAELAKYAADNEVLVLGELDDGGLLILNSDIQVQLVSDGGAKDLSGKKVEVAGLSYGFSPDRSHILVRLTQVTDNITVFSAKGEKVASINMTTELTSPGPK